MNAHQQNLREALAARSPKATSYRTRLWQAVTFIGLTCLAACQLDALSQSAAPLPPAAIERTANGGRKITVTAGRNLQTALDQAVPGDVIALASGATFVGNFVLPRKSGTGWITIAPTDQTNFPAAGKRMTPEAAQAAKLPKIISPNADAALRTAPGAHHFRLIGLDISVAPNVADNHGLVLLGDGGSAQRTLAEVPHDLVIERSYIHGATQGNVSRGVALNSAASEILDSTISECHGIGFDTQAIAGWNGPGPYKIINNYLEGAGENVLFGGADPAIPNLVPADIEFRDNHCAKPLRWKKGEPEFAGKPWTIKNIFELKNARRVVITGNLFENNWADAQNGFAILFTVRNQDGRAPWSVVEDVTFSNNVVRHAAAAINILGRDDIHPSGQAQRIQVSHNLFEDIGGARWGGNGRFLQLTETDRITVDHNTIHHTGPVVFGYGKPNTGFIFTNNVAAHNEYGVIGDAVGVGMAALEKFFPGAQFKKNLLAGGRSNIYPPDNFFPAALEREALSGSRQPGTDGSAIGCDMTRVRAVSNRVRAAEQTAVR